MKVSILVPIYNVEVYLARCLDSLLNQDYKDIEYIFVDDSSTDDSFNILNKKVHDTAKDIKIYKNSENLGLAVTRNILLSHASGEYIIFVDSDDWIELNAISILVDTIIEHQFPDIVHFGYMIENGKFSIKSSCNYPKDYESLLYKTIAVEVDTFNWTKIIKTAFLKNNHLIFELGIDFGEDYLMAIKQLVLTTSVIDIPNYLYHYNRANIESVTRTVSNENFVTLFDRVNQFLNQNNLNKHYFIAFDQRRFMFKKNLILEMTPPNWNAFRIYYPEVNYMWKYVPLGRINKFIFYLLYGEHYFCAKLVYLLSRKCSM